MRNSNPFRNYFRETKNFRKRIVVAIFIILAMLLILITRLFNLQIFNYKLYTKLSTNNQLEYLPIAPNRGLIYDRNGILLAENLPTFTLSIATKHAKNIENTIEKLNAFINITPRDIKQFKKAYKRAYKRDNII